MIPKRPKPSPQKLDSPLDAKKREIAEQEARNRAEMARCQKLIEELPERAEKLAQARREKKLAGASQTDRRRATPQSLHDPRHYIPVHTPPPAPPKRLRAERRQGRLHFFLLLLLLLGLSYWLYLALIHS